MNPLDYYAFLHMFIFTKIHKFYTVVFNSKRAWLYAGIMTISIGSFALMTLSLFLDYFFLPDPIWLYNGENLQSLIISVCILFYVHHKKRYLKIIDECESISPEEDKRWKTISWIYIAFLFIAYFWLGFQLIEFYLEYPYKMMNTERTHPYSE